MATRNTHVTQKTLLRHAPTLLATSLVLLVFGAFNPGRNPDKKDTEHGWLLSEREEQVSIMLGQGYTNRQISRQLDISVHTVETYVKRIFRKLGVNSRAAVAGRILPSLLSTKTSDPGGT